MTEAADSACFNRRPGEAFVKRRPGKPSFRGADYVVTKWRHIRSPSGRPGHPKQEKVQPLPKTGQSAPPLPAWPWP
ncbi:hypothetical protein AVXHC19_07040 [Acidovorax sacchari]